MVHSAFKDCRIAIVGTLSEAKPEQLKKWIEHGSGKLSATIDEKVTHVIMSEKTWKVRGPPVESLLHRKAIGQKLHIMKYAWLDKCCSKRRHYDENKREYSWDREEAEAARAGKVKKNGESKSTAGLVGQVFMDATDSYIDEHEKKRAERQAQAEKAAEKEAEETRYKEFMNQRHAQRRKEVAACFRKGAQRAKQELMSDNHHIYTDPTGFTYDVTLTKIDTRKNRNERYTLTIYESNHDWPTYAVNAQFAGTGRTTTNNVIAVLGSNFQTAFRAFRIIFKEKTGVDWEDRIIAAEERNRQRGKENGERIGTPVNDADTRRQEIAFENAPFLYYPPKYGPQGEMHGQLPNVVPENNGQGSQQEDEYMMSGGNGNRADPAGLSNEEHDLGDEVYDEPHSFGQDRMDEEDQQDADRVSHQAQDLGNDSEYYQHTQMAEHAQGQLMDHVAQQQKRKISDEESDDEDMLPSKQARIYETEPSRENGEMYAFDFGDDFEDSFEQGFS